MRVEYRLFFVVIFLSVISKGHTQNCPRLGQNPTSAFPVCGTTTFVQNSVPLCAGSIIPGPCSAYSVTDRNPYWYSFTCYVAGTLGFLITPNNLADDYDWQLFDVTGRNRDDIYTDPSLFVACNWSGFGGITGASSAGTNIINCGGNFPIFSSMPSLIASHDYLLMVSHWTNTQSGYQLSFTMGTPGGGTASIIDPANPIPEVTTASASCDGTQIVVHFNKTVKCNSLVLDGSDFIISPSGSISSALGYGCSTGFVMDSVLLTLSAPLAAGNYTVAAANGNDGNTLMDNCDRTIVVGDDATFTINPPAPLPMGTVTPPSCVPASLTLTFADPVKCNSIAANGSDFTITGPSAVTVSSATAANCNANGETTSITIQFSAPILVTGNYIVQMATGTDGNTLIGNCNRQVTAGSTTPFTLAPQQAIAMGAVNPPPCLPSSITLTFADPVLCSSIAANGSDFVITGPSVAMITSAMAVSCTNGEAISITLQLTGPILATGTFQVQMVVGTDGNTLVGQCGRAVTVGSNTQFVLPLQPAIAMGTIATPPPCVPSSLTLTFADPVFCTSIAANGSDFVITGPSAVVINSATTVNCNANGQTNTITIQFAAPVLISGTYQVRAATGSDGNTLVGQCNRQVVVGDNTTFILDPQPPIPMGTIPATNCSPSSITLNFTDTILCNSIAANGSDFIITGPAPVTITSATGTCNTNGETNTITLRLSAPITVSGSFQAQMVTGSDGNTLIGNCNRRTTAGEFASFTIPVTPPVAMDSLVPIACSPSSLKLIFASPIRCSSIAANGSDFIINGPSGITVAAAAGTCDANGLTTSIDIQLGSPIVRGGLYTLQLVNGSDGNTLLSDCNRQTPVGSSLNITASDTVSAEFQYQVQYNCQADVITFSHDGQHNVNQWTWTVNGTAAGTSQTFTQSFSSASQNQVQLVVSNGLCSDTYLAVVNLNNKVTVDFDLPESVCPEDTVVFKNKSTGQIDNWQWTFGNGNTSTVQNPPAQIYPLTGTETLYTVSLTASNNGCQATATKTLKVLSACIIAVPSAFTPNNDGLNDYLYPLNALKAENLDFKVFDRWGQLIFHSKDWQQKWDGRVNGILQATGVYIWMLDFTHKDTKQKYSMKGTTTLIR